MKTAIVFVLTLVSIVHGQDSFQFPEKDPVCVLARFNASFELTLTDGNTTESVTVTLPTAKDVTVDGSCANISAKLPIATLTLGFDNDDYKLLLTLTENEDKVSVVLEFLINHPNTTFKNFNSSDPVSLSSSGALWGSNSNQSYLCNAQEIIILTGIEKEFNISANVSFTDLHIQGFGVKDSKFSEPNECSADTPSTTTASTTTAMTTPMPTPPVGVGNYTLTVGNKTCLRLDANISISVSYSDKQGNMTERTVMVPGDAAVSGKCGDEQISLVLTVEDKAALETSGNLNFVFKKMEDYSFISSIDFALNFSDANGTITRRNDDTNNVLSQSDEFFTCYQEKFMLQKDSVLLQDIKVQAFDLAEGDFSSSGLNCSKLPPKSPTSGNYTVKDGNVTCISMVAAITLKVNYLDKDSKNKTIDVNFEFDQPTGGKCSSGNETAEYIIVKYKQEKFSAEFEFEKESKVSSSLGADAFSYYVKNITVKYTLDPEIFTDAKTPDADHTFSLTNQKLLQTSSDKYYMCSAESTFKINPSVSLVTKNLRLVAFHTDDKDPNLFGSNAEECAGDTETNSVVPIAVGAALAGLVVIVLIAYLIGRRRNHKGYESV